MGIKPVFLEDSILQICFSKVYLSSSVTPRSSRELEKFRSNPLKVNEAWGFPDRLIVIECVLWGLSFIPHIEHYNWILNKTLLKELSTFIWSDWDATAYKIILFSKSLDSKI